MSTPLNFQTGISRQGIFLPKNESYTLISSSRAIDCRQKKSIGLGSKFDFFAVGQVSNVSKGVSKGAKDKL